MSHSPVNAEVWTLNCSMWITI